mmetsp:Transcript_29710/g.41822  ORF Transcript_29710/g.41822 Transcript_29710/m.41822 type:complete len:350 (-) Transcript_29710:11-1060(-)
MSIARLPGHPTIDVLVARHHKLGLNFPFHSRVHKLQTWSNENTRVFLKREDELRGIGTKIRKYASIIPHVMENKYDEILAVGGLFSNNIVLAAQLFKEHRIPAHYLIRKIASTSNGNQALFKALVSDKECTFISPTHWKDIDLISNDIRTKQKANKKVYLLPEGATTEEAIEGLSTLAYDIIENEKQLQLEFDHIFVDSGTGITASTLISTLQHLDKKATVHVVLLAPSEKEFESRLNKTKDYMEQHIFKQPVPLKMNRVNLHKPTVSPSFGSVNTQLFESIIRFARAEGVLTDPVYNMKTFVTAQEIMKEKGIKGNVLLIHSGGTTSIVSYPTQLQTGLKAVGDNQSS